MTVSYRATLDVPDHIVYQVARWLTAWRAVRDARPWQRAATPFAQAVMFLRWARDDARVHVIAHDAGVSQATAYRHIHEVTTVVAAHGKTLEEVLDMMEAAEEPRIMLDGTLIASDRCHAKDPETGFDLWYSGKHRRHGANIQVVMDSTGYPMWTSAASPGRAHDMVAAADLVLPSLYPRAVRGLPVLADKGYVGAGAGVHVPVKGHRDRLDASTRCRNRLLCDMRAPCERANALLKTWKVLRHVTVCPRKIGTIVSAMLVLTHMKYPSRYNW
ncbi:MAG: transposase [Bifidobacteriaceae bacterium]|jgi:hypothetical protein|nr:transposase [Bifidobacteriaceae bacterium]